MITRQVTIMLVTGFGHNLVIKQVTVVIKLDDCCVTLHPIQYERAPLRVRCAMLRKHPPESNFCLMNVA